MDERIWGAKAERPNVSIIVMPVAGSNLNQPMIPVRIMQASAKSLIF